MIKMDYSEERRSLVIKNDEKEIKVFESASRPISNGSKWILISPYEWESKGEAHLIDTQKNIEISKLPILINEDESIKAITWSDDSNLFLIIGALWGTVNIGGNLYSFNIDKKERKHVKSFPSYVQVTNISTEGDNLVLQGIKYIDDEFNEFIDFKEQIKL